MATVVSFARSLFSKRIGTGVTVTNNGVTSKRIHRYDGMICEVGPEYCPACHLALIE